MFLSIVILIISPIFQDLNQGGTSPFQNMHSTYVCMDYQYYILLKCSHSIVYPGDAALRSPIIARGNPPNGQETLTRKFKIK
jgi:hypothetical protein